MKSLTSPKAKLPRSSILNKITKRNRLQPLLHRKEVQLIGFFSFLFLIIIIRLFQLQVLEHAEYDALLSKQHYREALLQPQRGNIYALDKGGHPIKLTENITLYDLAIDPYELQRTFESNPVFNVPAQLRGQPMKPRFIQLITPIIYKHLCEINGMQEVSHEQCVKNVELFAGVELLPKKPDLFYFGSGMASPEYETFDFTGYDTQYQSVLEQFNKEKALQLITEKLDKKIKIWIKSQNYLGYFSEPAFLEEVKKANLPYLTIEAENYLYITPSAVGNLSSAKQSVRALLNKRKYPIGSNFDKLFEPQQRRYIKIISGLNPALAQEVRDLKRDHLHEISGRDRTIDKLIRTPVLYSLVLEPYTSRYYPYENFMANILGYVDKNGNAHYGIEGYFDSILKGKKGEIRGRTSAWLGNVGSNEFEISNPVDGQDIYLTIDIGLQKEIERLAQSEFNFLKADWMSILVLDAQNGTVKSSVNVPSFDPNNYNDAYTYLPLGKEYAHLVDNASYNEVPVFVKTGGQFKALLASESRQTEEPKYLSKNVYGARVFPDRNISVPFEPGSIVKAFTMAIGLDADEFSFADSYTDEGSIKIDQWTIKNASKDCLGYNNFLHAFSYSCNVGMVRIIQKIGKYSFFNYMSKLGFGRLTDIELEGEKSWFIDNVNTASKTRIFNNAFGQGVTMTQIQLAAAYAALINGGEYLQPTIIQNIIDPQNPANTYTPKNQRTKIFKTETSEKMRTALNYIISTNPGYARSNLVTAKLWAKSGTAQIVYKWRYTWGEGRTNGTFAGIISTDNPKYVVLIWIRRPRSNQWWGNTAGPVFKKIAEYILNYDI